MTESISDPSPEVIIPQETACAPPVSPGGGSVVFKRCWACGSSKPLDEFYNRTASPDGKAAECKICSKARTSESSAANRERVNERTRQWYARTKEERLAKRLAMPERSKKRKSDLAKLRYANKREEILAANLEYVKKRKLLDPVFAMTLRLRTRASAAIRSGYATGSGVRDLGCTVAEAREHIEAQFTDGMTWDNYGMSDGHWNMDHIVCLSFAPSMLPEHRKLLNHYSNLRPLWASDNIARNKYGLAMEELKSLGLVSDSGEILPPALFPEKFPLRTLDTNAATMLT